MSVERMCGAIVLNLIFGNFSTFPLDKKRNLTIMHTMQYEAVNNLGWWRDWQSRSRLTFAH